MIDEATQMNMVSTTYSIMESEGVYGWAMPTSTLPNLKSQGKTVESDSVVELASKVAFDWTWRVIALRIIECDPRIRLDWLSTPRTLLETSPLGLRFRLVSRSWVSLSLRDSRRFSIVRYSRGR